MKVVVAGGDRGRDSLVVHLARAVYVFAQSLVDVALRAALFHLLLVVELDLGDQQAREAVRVVMQPTLFVTHVNGQFRIGAAVASRYAERSGKLGGRGRLRGFGGCSCFCGRRRGSLLLRRCFRRCRFRRLSRCLLCLFLRRRRRSSSSSSRLFFLRGGW